MRAPAPIFAPAPTKTGGTSRAAGLTSAVRIDERVVGAERVAELGGEVALEHVAMGLQIGVRGPDVEPVAGERNPVDRLLLDEKRKDLALDRNGAARRDQVEHVRLEHVQARVDQVGVDLLRARLFEEAPHLPVPVHPHEPVAGRILDGCEQDRRARWAARDGRRRARRDRFPAASRR